MRKNPAGMAGAVLVDVLSWGRPSAPLPKQHLASKQGAGYKNNGVAYK
jgi:hypothetical protein